MAAHGGGEALLCWCAGVPPCRCGRRRRTVAVVVAAREVRLMLPACPERLAPVALLVKLST